MQVAPSASTVKIVPSHVFSSQRCSAQPRALTPAYSTFGKSFVKKRVQLTVVTKAGIPTTESASGPAGKVSQSEPIVPGRRIVFSVDGTTGAEEGLRWVVKEIARKGDTIHLAHVIADPRTPSTAVGSSTAATQWSPARDERLYASEFFSRMEHEAHTMLESRFIPSLQFTGINYEVNLLRLKVHKSAAGIAEALANCARDVNADLLIIISHGAGVLADYGSVARWCSEHSTVPALLLPPDVIKSGPGGPPSNTVLVAASDDMAGLKSAFDFAMKGLTRPGDNVYIMHAKAVADEEAAVAARKELVANVLRWQGASAEPHAATLNIACDLVTEPACEQSTMAATATSESMAGGLTPLASPAAERLCVYASDLNARAVVLSHHGRSMAREMMFGPLTQHCTKFCSRPLVVLNETG